MIKYYGFKFLTIEKMELSIFKRLSGKKNKGNPIEIKPESKINNIVSNKINNIVSDKVDFSNIKNFDELKVYIKKLPKEGIRGSQKIYSPEDLLEIIDGVVLYGINIKRITNAGGLRDKVQELLLIEKYKKDILNVKGIGELKIYLQNFPEKEIIGSQKSYGIDEVLKIIDGVVLHGINIKRITNSYGLRDKVQDLLSNKNI